MYNSRTDILLSLDKTLTIYPAILNGVSEFDAHELRETVYDWSVVENICHLRDTELNAHERHQLIIEQEDPLLNSWSQDALALEKEYQLSSLEESLTDFMNAREQHLIYLNSLSADQWLRVGKHTKVGKMSVFTHSRHIASHHHNHLAQILRTLDMAR